MFADHRFYPNQENDISTMCSRLGASITERQCGVCAIPEVFSVIVSITIRVVIISFHIMFNPLANVIAECSKAHNLYQS